MSANLYNDFASGRHPLSNNNQNNIPCRPPVVDDPAAFNLKHHPSASALKHGSLKPFPTLSKQSLNPPVKQKAAPANPNPNRNTLFPLTGAFGLAKSPSTRSPATPTYQYAFADLERTKEFLPVTAPLNIVMGPRGSPSAQGKGQGKGC